MINGNNEFFFETNNNFNFFSEQRKVDDFGKLALPKILRQTSEIKEGENLKISLDMNTHDTIFIHKDDVDDNYIKQKMALSSISIQDIVKASDYINELSSFIQADNEVLDYLEDIQRPLLKVIQKCQTEHKCPHCGCNLYLSDLPQYSYVCPECDENFYSFEVEK